MRKVYFTLVELLTVIAVIAILAGIAIPVVVGMQSKGKETSARADMNAIKMALTQFKADYSIWPQVGPDSSLTASGDLLMETPFSPSGTLSHAETAYDKLTQSLTNNTVDATTPTAPSDLYGNTRKKRYLDPPAKTVETKNSKTGYYQLDPWGRRYNIALDWNYNGKIDLDSAENKKFAQGTETAPILGQILIYSYGTAEADDDTEAFLYSWKTNAQ